MCRAHDGRMGEWNAQEAVLVERVSGLVRDRVHGAFAEQVFDGTRELVERLADALLRATH